MVTNERIEQLIKRESEFERPGSLPIVNDVAECLRELLALRKENEWISVEERLPEDGVKVLCSYDDGYMELSFRHAGGWGAPPIVGDRVDRPYKFWRPLPAPPEENR